MVVYELTHIFFRCECSLVSSPKSLGFYSSYESAQQAIQHYRTQPGFCENPDAFSCRERTVLGNVTGGTIFEAIVYLHTENYEFEAEMELGLYGAEADAQGKIEKYCAENAPLVNAAEIMTEKIVNRCIVDKLEWSEGFSIFNEHSAV